MTIATTTDADDLDDEAPARPTRRDGRIVAIPAEPIPAEVNEAFLEDLAFERVLSAARGLAFGSIGFTEPPAGGLQAARGHNSPEKPRGRPDHPCPFLSPTRKENELNASQTTDIAILIFTSSARPAPPKKRTPT
jgi:hypothetical protein